MTARQAVLFAVTGAVAFAAALLFRPATAPGRIHHAAHAEVFEDTAADLPALASSAIPGAPVAATPPAPGAPAPAAPAGPPSLLSALP